MIEEYIEKNILRQLFLCGQFYVNKEVNLEKLSNLLHVCKTTLLNDINNIKKEFEEQIAYTHREKDRYTLYFSEHIPRCKIMQQLSQNSLFLKTCLLYLEEDEPDYLQLTECEFISVSKAYSLKKQVLAYFNDCGIEIDRYSPRFTEMERRLLLLNVSYRLGGFNSWELPESFFERADRFIESVTENSGRFYDKENKEILSIGFAISFLRQQVCAVTIDSKFIEEIKKRPIYNYVESAWENTDFQTYYKKEEFAFILTLFNLCNYGFHSYQLIAEDFQQLHQVFIDNTPEIKELVATFESHFNQELFGNQPFERALIHLMRSAWDNYQLFMPEKFYLLNEEQTNLYKEVQTIFSSWSSQLPYDLRLNPNYMRAFVIELSGILRLTKEHLTIYIVTNSDVHYLIYREALEAVTTFDFQVAPTIYSSISDIKKYAQQSSNRVLCERTLYTPDAVQYENIIPISINTIDRAIISAVQNK